MRSDALIVREMRSPGGAQGGHVTELSFSADGRHLLVGTTTFAVRLWGTFSGQVELLAPPLVSERTRVAEHGAHAFNQLMRFTVAH